MTRVPIAEIPEEGLPLSYSEDPAELDLAVSGVRFPQPIAVDLVLVKAAQLISATGRIKASVMCECVRCLSPFLVQLDIPVATQFVPAQPLLPQGNIECPRGGRGLLLPGRRGRPGRSRPARSDPGSPL